MTMNNPYAQYRQTQANTASQAKLIIMLHDGAICALQQAIAATQSKDYEKMARHFGKASEIVGHLCSSVRPDCGEVPDNLTQIYIYCLKQITIANAREDVVIIDEVIGHIRNIRDAWDAVEHAKSNSDILRDKKSHEKADMSLAA